MQVLVLGALDHHNPKPKGFRDLTHPSVGVEHTRNAEAIARQLDSSGSDASTHAHPNEVELLSVGRIESESPDKLTPLQCSVAALRRCAKDRDEVLQPRPIGITLRIQLLLQERYIAILA